MMPLHGLQAHFDGQFTATATGSAQPSLYGFQFVSLSNIRLARKAGDYTVLVQRLDLANSLFAG